MDFDKIIAISGQSSLFGIINPTQFGLIAESLENGKKMPVYSHYTVSKLEDISVYTEEGDVSLKEVLLKIFAKAEGKEVSGLNTNDEYRNYLREVLPNFDQEKVYTSDIKKMIKWYNQLVGKSLIDAEAWNKKDEAAEDGKEKEEVKKAETKTKKTTVAKTKTAAVKNAPAKKVQTVRKSGGS